MTEQEQTIEMIRLFSALPAEQQQMMIWLGQTMDDTASPHYQAVRALVDQRASLGIDERLDRINALYRDAQGVIPS